MQGTRFEKLLNTPDVECVSAGREVVVSPERSREQEAITSLEYAIENHQKQKETSLLDVRSDQMRIMDTLDTFQLHGAISTPRVQELMACAQLSSPRDILRELKESITQADPHEIGPMLSIGRKLLSLNN
mgnify:CR=1 FL=1